jgi:hypothetical protein
MHFDVVLPLEQAVPGRLVVFCSKIQVALAMLSDGKNTMVQYNESISTESSIVS